MNPELQKKWDEAAATGVAIPVGDIVVCDCCNVDYTNRTDLGGFIFAGMAYCPKCAIECLPGITSYGKAHLVRAWAKNGEAFADFVRRIRGPDSFIRITALSKTEE